jgi:hypothetical protein
VIKRYVAGTLAGGVLCGERMQLAVLHAKAGDFAGGLVVEGLDLDGGEEDLAIG